MMCRTEITQRDVRFTLEPLAKRKRDVRLADTRLPGKHHHSAFSLRGVPPSAQQQLYLLFAPEQRRQLGLVPRLEAALHAARPQHLPDRYPLRPAFQRDRAEIAVIEVPPSEPAGARADQHRPRLRQRLQTRGEVRRLTDDGLLRRGFVNEEFGHNDSTCRNANANLQRGVETGAEIRHRIDEREGGAHCLFGVILLRAWIAEIGEHAVAHISGDHALVAPDDVVDAGVIGRDHPPHVFRVQPCRKGSRADQIAKHHR